MARFWDTHDLTEFEDELEEVKEMVFECEARRLLRLRLEPEEAEALHRLAQSRGMDDTALVKEWVAERLHAS